MWICLNDVEVEVEGGENRKGGYRVGAKREKKFAFFFTK